MLLMMEQAKKKKSRQAEIQLSPACLAPSHTPPVVCAMSEKIYKIEIENKLTTLFVAHAEGQRERAGAGEMLRHY